MAEQTSCQRPDCDRPGKQRTITNPAKGGKVKLCLCDQDYDAACANKQSPLWLRELLTHIGLVG